MEKNFSSWAALRLSLAQTSELFKERTKLIILVSLLLLVPRLFVPLMPSVPITFGLLPAVQPISFSLGFQHLLFIYDLLVVIYLAQHIAKDKIKKTNLNSVYVYLRAIGMYLWRSLMLVWLTLLFIVPSLIYFFYWQFALYVLLFENYGIFKSLKRSRQLVQKKWPVVLVYTMIYQSLSFGQMALLFISSASLLPFYLHFLILLFATLVQILIVLYTICVYDHLVALVRNEPVERW